MRLLRLHLVIALSASPLLADWPAYRNSARRSGYTTNTLPATLALRWTHQTAAPPQPAWPRSARMQFDRAFHPVIAGGLVAFGSSADDTVYALHADSGALVWTFVTEAPVRFAPLFHKGKLYAGSDDGFLYCLDASSGKLLWKRRGGPDNRRILGNGRLISAWPVRGGPVVVDDILYFAAGIWPSDGIQIHALNPETGETLWLNDSAGSIYMGQPHGGAYADSGVSAQGYLAATASQLFLPTGRSVPAAFDRATGTFQYFHLQANGHQGGSDITLADQFLINSGIAFNQNNGQPAGKITPGPVAATPDGIVCVSESTVAGYLWADITKVDRKGAEQTVRGLTNSLNAAAPKDALSAITTPDQIVIGTRHGVTLLDRTSGARLWNTQLDGAAYGLAVSGNRLYVATDQGALHCFDASGATPRTLQPRLSETPARDDDPFAMAAREILKDTGLTKGYCLDLACGEGRLALELARRSELHVIALESDPLKAAAARERISRAGLYGTRITVLDLPVSDLPAYFANLVVAGTSVTRPDQPLPLAQRQLRPYGGIRCVGAPGALKITRRGPLEGAGNWTHQYSDAANTTCSDDEYLKGPLRMLWFTDVGQQMTQRHGRAPAPLFNNGILYSEGLDGIVAVDAYNGTTLWEYKLPGILKPYDGDHLMGTSGTGSNYCLSDDSLYVRTEDYCLRIDARTGKLISKISSPKTPDGKQGTWGYLAFDDGVLYGSLANPEHVVTYRYLQGGDMARQLTESTTLFAIDPESGRQLWRYDAQHSIRHNSISVGAGYVVLIDRPMALTDRVRGTKATNHVTGDLVALYAGSGEVLWRNTNDIYGTLTTISPGHQKVIMGYQPTRFRLDSEIGGRISCYDLSTGEEVWDRKSDYASRPMINGNTVYAQGAAWDLFTGEDRPFNFSRSYGCGILAGARELMVYRSATLGYFDLKENRQSRDYGGLRPGCWINIIPAGGLVLAPDASAGCKCSYQNQSWIALQPADIRPPFIDPPGGASRQPVRVTLLPDLPDAESVHFTLDGSSPTRTSPRYEQPIVIGKTTTVRARSFDHQEHSSALATARFIVDPDLIPLSPEHWTVVDAPGAVPTSNWSLESDTVAQTANTFLNTPATMSPNPGAERPGTLRLFTAGGAFADGDLNVQIQSGDDDGVGIAFRAQNDHQYYLWTMHKERGFHSLAVKNGDDYTLLASNHAGYETDKWHDIRIRLRGADIRIEVDGQPDLEAHDDTFASGTVALYAWGNTGARFRNLTFKDRPSTASDTQVP